MTVHRISTQIDAGPIAFQARFPLAERETAFTLNARCIREGVSLLRRLVETAAAGEPIPKQIQDLGRRAYFGRGAPEGGCIDWSWPAARVDRLVRALSFAPFPPRFGDPRARLGGDPIGIREVLPTGIPTGERPGTVRHSEGTVQAACGDAWLQIVRVSSEGVALAAAKKLSPGDLLEPG